LHGLRLCTHPFFFPGTLNFLNRHARLQKDPARRNDEAPGLL